MDSTPPRNGQKAPQKRSPMSLDTPPPPSQEDNPTHHYVSPMTTPLCSETTDQDGMVSTPHQTDPDQHQTQTPSIMSISSPYQQATLLPRDMFGSPPRSGGPSAVPNPCFIPAPTPRGRGAQAQYLVIQQEPIGTTTTPGGRGTSKRSTAKNRGRGGKTGGGTPSGVTTNTVKQDDEIQFVVDKGIPQNAGRRGGARSQRLDSLISNGTEMSQEDQRMYKTRENERKRRAAQKSSADRLRELVPGLVDNKSRKVGEGIVMQKSAEYIELLHGKLLEKSRELAAMKKDLETKDLEKRKMQLQAHHYMESTVPLILKLHKANKHLENYSAQIEAVKTNRMDKSNLTCVNPLDTSFDFDKLSPEVIHIVKVFFKKIQEKKINAVAAHQQKAAAAGATHASATTTASSGAGKTTKSKNPPPPPPNPNTKELQLRAPILQNVNAGFIPIQSAGATALTIQQVNLRPQQLQHPQQQVILTPVVPQDRIRVHPGGGLIRQPVILPSSTNQRSYSKLIGQYGGARIHRVLSPMAPTVARLQGGAVLPQKVRLTAPASLVAIKDSRGRVNIADTSFVAKNNAEGQQELFVRCNDGSLKCVMRAGQQIRAIPNLRQVGNSGGIEIVNVAETPGLAAGCSTIAMTPIVPAPAATEPPSVESLQLNLVSLKEEIEEVEEQSTASQPQVDTGEHGTEPSNSDDRVFGDVGAPDCGFSGFSSPPAPAPEAPPTTISLSDIKTEPMDLEEEEEHTPRDAVQDEPGGVGHQITLQDIKTEMAETVRQQDMMTGRSADDEFEDDDGEGARGRSPLPGFYIDGIGDYVDSDDEHDEDDDVPCGVFVENDKNGVCRIGETKLPLTDEPSDDDDNDKPSTSRRDGKSDDGCRKQLSPVEYQALQVEAIEDDRYFRSHPLFKFDFIWDGYNNDPERKRRVAEIVQQCWDEVRVERKQIDKELEEMYKRRKNDDAEFGKRRGGGGGKRGGGRGKKRGGGTRKW